VSLALLALFVGVGYFAILISSKKRRARLQARSPVVPPGHVRLIFYKYTGFLVVVRQTEIDVVLSADAAQTMLRQLVRHNLIFGLFTYYGPLVPFLTFFNYRSEKKKIDAARRSSSLRP
jgi:hypothetical protein